MKRGAFVILLVLCFSILVILEVSRPLERVPPTLIRIDNPEPQANALFGRAVNEIDDIDGDGIGDLIIGASGADKVYALSGIDHSIIHIIEDPDDLSGCRFGYAVCGVGDLNGDRIEDFAVGAPGPAGDGNIPSLPRSFASDSDPAWGRAFTFSGANGELIHNLHSEHWDYLVFGASIVPLDDVNGDGITDIAVGAPAYLHGLATVYAFSGHDGSQIWTSIEPYSSPGELQEIASFGAYLTEVDDLNRDGCKDLLVSAPYFDCNPDPDNCILAGKVFVLDDSDGTIFRTHDNPAPTTQGDFFGAGLGAVGDQDGDGITDYAFGECGVGMVHLFSGANGNLIATINSPSGLSTDYFGFRIVCEGDKDGDGLDDFWVAAPMEGIVYLINSMGDVLVQVDDPNPDFLEGEEGFGWRVSSTGDLDGDDKTDLMIGKPRESIEGFERAGTVVLVLSNIPAWTFFGRVREIIGLLMRPEILIPLVILVSVLAFVVAFIRRREKPQVSSK